jgi:hypothetical protein
MNTRKNIYFSFRFLFSNESNFPIIFRTNEQTVKQYEPNSSNWERKIQKGRRAFQTYRGFCPHGVGDTDLE